MKCRSWAAAFALWSLGAAGLAGAAPVLFSHPEHGAPVTGRPGELLLLAGAGMAVDDAAYYERLDPATPGAVILTPPATLPPGQTAARGPLRIVGRGHEPHSHVVELPAVLDPHAVYRLRLRTSAGTWSNAVLINDPRPRWLSPAYAYSSQSLPGLGRTLRVVGRNLGAAPGSRRELRLVGPQTVTLTAPAEQGEAALASYELAVELPARLAAGRYAVEVRIGDKPWARLAGRDFEVRADRVSPVFAVEEGGCGAGANVDHAACIRRVIAAAARTGGQVVFGDGEWLLGDSTATPDGIVVPSGVSLAAAPNAHAVIRRGANWGHRPAFVLVGSNRVEHLTFADDTRYVRDDGMAFLQVGTSFAKAVSGSATDRTVSDVVISGNRFDRTYAGIGDGGRPIRRLVVTDNVFGAFAFGINLEGDGFSMHDEFTVEDAVIRGNTFHAGSLLDEKRAFGPIASNLGAARRLDFSHNFVNGASTDYLYEPNSRVRGFRAGLFFALRGNVESLLVADNDLDCTGDRAGDGEAIAFDSNHNSPAFGQVASVTSATATSVTTSAPLLTRGEYGALPGGFFRGYWVQVVGGRGLGQVRRVQSYEEAGRREFMLDSPWDVIPDASSRILVNRLMTDVVVVANRIDQRAPLCTKHNPTRPAGGAIALAANMADSVVDSNRQYDTNGIDVIHEYTVEDAKLGRGPGATLQYFIAIRDNLVDHEYLWESDASWSGIELGYAIAPTPGITIPVGGYGESISGNTVIKADGLRGGAIAFAPTWFKGPEAGPPPAFIESPLVVANHVRDIRGKPAGASAGYRALGLGARRVGITVSDRLVSNLILAGNTCEFVDTPLVNGSPSTVIDCPPGSTDTCACRHSAAPRAEPAP